jgi:hypothetical protein
MHLWCWCCLWCTCEAYVAYDVLVKLMFLMMQLWCWCCLWCTCDAVIAYNAPEMLMLPMMHLWCWCCLWYILDAVVAYDAPVMLMLRMMHLWCLNHLTRWYTVLYQYSWKMHLVSLANLRFFALLFKVKTTTWPRGPGNKHNWRPCKLPGRACRPRPP